MFHLAILDALARGGEDEIWIQILVFVLVGAAVALWGFLSKTNNEPSRDADEELEEKLANRENIKLMQNSEQTTAKEFTIGPPDDSPKENAETTAENLVLITPALVPQEPEPAVIKKKNAKRSIKANDKPKKKKQKTSPKPPKAEPLNQENPPDPAEINQQQPNSPPQSTT